MAQNFISPFQLGFITRDQTRLTLKLSVSISHKCCLLYHKCECIAMWWQFLQFLCVTTILFSFSLCVLLSFFIMILVLTSPNLCFSQFPDDMICWKSDSMHYAARAMPMGAMTFWILELCFSFFPHSNILEGNFNTCPSFFSQVVGWWQWRVVNLVSPHDLHSIK